MDELLAILNEIHGGVDYETCTTLIDDGILDSFAVLTLVTELQDSYGITIGPADIVPENFNSLQAIYDLVERLQ